MSKKTFVVIFVLSVVVWFISALIQGYKESFVSGRIAYSFFGSSCQSTGYPIAQCLNEFETPYGFYLVNIFFWFVIIWVIWKFLKRVVVSK